MAAAPDVPVRPRAGASCQPDRVEETSSSTVRSKVDHAEFRRSACVGEPIYSSGPRSARRNRGTSGAESPGHATNHRDQVRHTRRHAPAAVGRGDRGVLAHRDREPPESQRGRPARTTNSGQESQFFEHPPGPAELCQAAPLRVRLLAPPGRLGLPAAAAPRRGRLRAVPAMTDQPGRAATAARSHGGRAGAHHLTGDWVVAQGEAPLTALVGWGADGAAAMARRPRGGMRDVAEPVPRERRPGRASKGWGQASNQARGRATGRDLRDQGWRGIRSSRVCAFAVKLAELGVLRLGAVLGVEQLVDGLAVLRLARSESIAGRGRSRPPARRPVRLVAV